MTETVLRSSPEKRRFNIDMRALSPFIALIVLMIAGALINPDFLTASNLLNVVTRSAFIAIIAVGATFVISSGGLDLSVGSMAALTAGLMILTLNSLGNADMSTLALGMLAAIAVSAACGLANGLIITFGRIEPFIVTLGTMGIYRSLVIWLAAGGTITMRNSDLRELYRPVYFGDIYGVPVPIIAFLVVAAIGALILYRTSFGRHVIALGSNEDVARYSGVPIWRVRTLTYIIQGICVGIAVLVYVPRLGSATPTTGLLWELQAITAVVIGGTALKGGVGRIWGTVVGAVILEVVANIMVLSNFVSEFLVGAVQGAIIIIAMLVQRSVHRGR
ncbi:ribose transport system permease protein [Microvirga lupini]|uniref:Ribose transport system permease protein n=1 Tax=Microvirga lupini TaxID=420324 RepID=A0A7W4YYH5_9HYPH|nr:ABC transporter permease [Microvirga lupini]MBB3020329.1 ribose transport system permease protein [Microvirga lupini]